jgi:8-amino-7-oxononanoate synthase
LLPYNPLYVLATYMTHRNPRSIEEALIARKSDGSLRSLAPVTGIVDLCSNDYLGLARRLSDYSLPGSALSGPLGATGSRLVSGTTETHEAIERYLAQFHQTPAALLFGSGYEANLGLLGCIGNRRSTILYDEYAHASMRDGIRLSHSRGYSFRHNDLDDLRRKIRQARGEVFVVVESIYSMDGDSAPLAELCDLCDEIGAYLLVDEAHATGVFGAHGEGRVQELGLSERVFARVHTFGKALGYRGAVIVGSELLRDYLINFARSFVYSTAPDVATLGYIKKAYQLMSQADTERSALRELVATLRARMDQFPELTFLRSDSPIQGVIIPSNGAVVQAEEALKEAGFFAKGIRSPTVPVGRERIRICLHSYNTIDEVVGLLNVLQDKQTGRAAYG